MFQKAEKAEHSERVGAVVLKSGPSAVRTPRICELLHRFGPVLSALAGYLMEKFHPGDGAMTESIPSTP